MKITKKNNGFIALLVLTATFNSHPMKRLRENESAESFPFTDLPPEMRYKIVQLLGISSTAQSIEEAGKAINTFAQTNQELYELINEPKICLKIIKNLSQRFKCSDQEAAEALKTPEAQRRLELQNKLQKAVAQNNIPEVTALCQQTDIDLSFTYFKFNILTVLILAAMKNSCSIIQILLSYGADINAADAYGRTALHHVASDGYTGTVQCLLNNPNIVIDQQSNEGYTPLMGAAAENIYHLIPILLNHGANINMANADGETALIIAAIYGATQAVQYLLTNRNIEINQQDKKGNTALILAMETGNPALLINTNAQSKLIIPLLLDAGADPELANNEGLTPLQAAEETGDQKIINLIQDAIQKEHKKK